MAGVLSQALAPAGTTSNNSHASVSISPVPQLIAVEFVVEVAGGTPTVTFALQGTFDAGTVIDANALWFPLSLLPSDSETAAATRVVTAVGGYASYFAQNQVRFVPRVRLVTTLNTNITYRANLRSQYRN